MYVTEAERTLLEDTVLPRLADRLDGYSIVDMYEAVEEWRASFEDEIERLADSENVPRISDTPATLLLAIPRYFVVEDDRTIDSLEAFEDDTYSAAIDPGLKHVELCDPSLREAFEEPMRQWEERSTMQSFSYLKGDIDTGTVSYSVRTDWRFRGDEEDATDLTEEDVAFLVEGPLSEDAEALLDEGYTTLLWTPVTALQALLVLLDEKPAASFFGRCSDPALVEQLVDLFTCYGLHCAVRRLEIGDHPPYIELFVAHNEIRGEPFLHGEMDYDDHRALGDFLGYPAEDVEAFVERERDNETLRDEWEAGDEEDFDLHATIADTYDIGEEDIRKLKALTYYGIRDSEEAVEQALEAARRRYDALEALDGRHEADVMALIDRMLATPNVAGYREEKELLDEELLPTLEAELDGLTVVDCHVEMNRLVTRLERTAEDAVYTGFIPVVEMPVQGRARSYSIPEYFVVEEEREIDSVSDLHGKEYRASIDIGLKHVEVVENHHEEAFERFGERWEEQSHLQNLLGFVKRPIGIDTTTYTYR